MMGPRQEAQSALVFDFSIKDLAPRVICGERLIVLSTRPACGRI